jgi:transcriptional regulator of acetoin/glycerol metabolism
MSDDRDGRHATTTASSDESKLGRRSKPVPGLVLTYADRRPAFRIFRADHGPFELGRSELATVEVLDGMISRRHVRVSFDGEWVVEDLASLNGTFVGGRRVSGEARAAAGASLRVGGAMLLAVADIVPFEHYGLGERDGIVSGPSLRRALETIALTQRTSPCPSLLVEGESGTGRELAARAFHAAGPRPNGPFCAVNCSTIPRDLAERLLFGSRRAELSGASDADGYVQAADGGTLFLDDLAELPPDVQSKLLRLLETGEVLRLGATETESVELSLCAATCRDLREEVAGGRFRRDLYFRVGKPEVRLAPLRERLEELPWHVQQVLDELGRAEPQIAASASFIEACMLRMWPGNVRELRSEVRRAAAAVTAEGSRLLAAEDLGATAGNPIARQEKPVVRFPEDDVAKALELEAGNVLGAARRLGVHRNKVRRWLERHHVDAEAFKRRTSL